MEEFKRPMGKGACLAAAVSVRDCVCVYGCMCVCVVLCVGMYVCVCPWCIWIAAIHCAGLSIVCHVCMCMQYDPPPRPRRTRRIRRTRAAAIQIMRSRNPFSTESKTKATAKTTSKNSLIRVRESICCDDHQLLQTPWCTPSPQCNTVLANLAEVYVNGKQVPGPTVLAHGDRIIIGANHVLRFSNPKREEDHNDIAGIARAKVW